MKRRYLVAYVYTKHNGAAGIGSAFLTMSVNLTQKAIVDCEEDIVIALEEKKLNPKRISITSVYPLELVSDKDSKETN